MRQALLVHLLARDPGWEPMHHARPLAQSPHDPVPDRQVVLDQIELGLSSRREVDPVRIRDPHRPLPDLQLNRRGLRLSRLGLRHANNLTAPPDIQQQPRTATTDQPPRRHPSRAQTDTHHQLRPRLVGGSGPSTPRAASTCAPCPGCSCRRQSTSRARARSRRWTATPPPAPSGRRPLPTGVARCPPLAGGAGRPALTNLVNWPRRPPPHAQLTVRWLAL